MVRPYFYLHLQDTRLTSNLDWTPIDLHEKLLRVVAQASARIFVGFPMCRNEEWLECSTKFALDVMTGGEKLKQWHPWLRPLAQYWVPEMTCIRGDHRRALELCKKITALPKRQWTRFMAITTSIRDSSPNLAIPLIGNADSDCYSAARIRKTV